MTFVLEMPHFVHIALPFPLAEITSLSSVPSQAHFSSKIVLLNMPFSENIIVLYATSVLCTSFSSNTYPTIFSNYLFTCLSL